LLGQDADDANELLLVLPFTPLTTVSLFDRLSTTSKWFSSQLLPITDRRLPPLDFIPGAVSYVVRYYLPTINSAFVLCEPVWVSTQFDPDVEGVARSSGVWDSWFHAADVFGAHCSLAPAGTQDRILDA
jgi:hypothetical protein